MIKSKNDLNDYIYCDNGYLNEIQNKKRKFYMGKVKDAEALIDRYLKYLRKQEYYINTCGSNKIKKLLALYYERKKHSLGNMLGFYIGPNCCEKGLTLFHHGTVIINPRAKIDANCKFHGNNCVGNNGKSDACPIIGCNVDVGFGAVIIGNVEIADDIKIGANAVVNKSFTEPGITIAGVPAKKVSY